MITVALYARVSTKDKGQSTENQLPELRRFSQAHGCVVYKKYKAFFASFKIPLR
jgi:DNA invertase Pin-like site-specific DNA recombinase